MPESNANAAKKKVRTEKQKKKRMDAVMRYINETKSEFKKIVWPTREVVTRNTIVVLAMILLVGVLIWCLDSLSTMGINAILKNY